MHTSVGSYLRRARAKEERTDLRGLGELADEGLDLRGALVGRERRVGCEAAMTTRSAWPWRQRMDKGSSTHRGRRSPGPWTR